MKALTIKEPYATLIAKNIKKYEFRSWNTKYRGDILIHAANTLYPISKNFDYNYRPGEFVALAKIKDVIKLDEKTGKSIRSENPKIYGYHEDGYAWVLDDIKPINNSAKIKGKLGLWNYEI